MDFWNALYVFCYPFLKQEHNACIEGYHIINLLHALYIKWILVKAAVELSSELHDQLNVQPL